MLSHTDSTTDGSHLGLSHHDDALEVLPPVMSGGSPEDHHDRGDHEDGEEGEGCGGGHDEGGSFDNRITGGSGIDILFGDRIAEGDNDLITGGKGPDVIFGNAGHDQLVGGKGGDLIFGGPGDDVLIGGKSRDFLCGGSGRDRLVGGQGGDLLVGGDGPDVINGGRGRNILYGGQLGHHGDRASDTFMLCPNGFAILPDFELPTADFAGDYLKIHEAETATLSLGISRGNTTIFYNGDAIARLMGIALSPDFDLATLLAPHHEGGDPHG
jgi:Ca2+-binding RTX toxin-like protein